jgi:hypothetical protein
MLTLLAATFVNELDRDSRRISNRHVRSCEFVTAITVIRDWLLRLPMTVEARRVICGHSFESSCARCVANRAVVIALLRVGETQHCDHSLVPIVRKFDRELQLRSGIPKREARLIARRRLRVTNRTDWRPRTAEKLRSVTTHTGVVLRVIFDVGVCRDFGPIFSRYFVTRVTARLMLRGCV